MTGLALPNPHRRSRKALWFALHGWFALPIWGFLALVCISGTLCVISEEITWLISPEVRAHKPDANVEISYQLVVASVKSRYPGAEIQSIQFTQPYIASLIRISLPNGDSRRLHVNQYTGDIQGEKNGTGFRGFILSLHGWLLFPWHNDYNLGWYLVTALSIPLLGSIISGLIVFKHFYRLILHPTLRVSRGSRIFWGDVHRLIAAWSIWFAIIISVSGLWFLVQGILDQNQIKIYPDKIRLNSESVAEKKFTQENISLDDVVSKAKVLFPALKITYIEFPEAPSDTLMIQGEKRFSLLRGTANTINFNPHDGSLVANRSAGDLSLIQLMPVLLMPLHFGDFAGLTSKLIWFFFGSLTSMLVCSGFVIWIKRTFHTTKRTLNIISYAPSDHHNQMGLPPKPDKQRLNKQNKIKRAIFWASWLIVFAPLYFFFS